MTFTQSTDREFPGLQPEARYHHVHPGVFLVARDGLILVETDSRYEARHLAAKRGNGAVATDFMGYVLGGGDY